MTKAEREAFLAGRHVGVLAIDGPAGRPPLTSPIWYAYEPGGDVVFIVDGSSQKMRRLEIQGRAALCAQTEDLPYKYVTVEGWVTAERTVDPDWRPGYACCAARSRWPTLAGGASEERTWTGWLEASPRFPLQTPARSRSHP